MATDQSPPRLGLIIAIGLGTVVTLVSLKFVFISYFTTVMEEAQSSKLVAPDEVNALHASEAAKLTNGPAVPIDQAMTQLSAQGRLGSTLITPQPSDDVAALTGWAHLHDVDQPEGSDGGAAAAPAMTAAATTGDAGAAPTATGDAGATPTAAGVDGGAATMPNAPNAPTADAGAPKPHATTANADAGTH
jgi:hypothetical protein